MFDLTLVLFSKHFFNSCWIFNKVLHEICGRISRCSCRWWIFFCKWQNKLPRLSCRPFLLSHLLTKVTFLSLNACTFILKYKSYLFLSKDLTIKCLWVTSGGKKRLFHTLQNNSFNKVLKSWCILIILNTHGSGLLTDENWRKPWKQRLW